MKQVNLYLEVGNKKTFAGAIEWPGWCRSGRDEEEALQALVAYAPRYARVLEGTGLRFEMPEDTSAMAVAERLDGDATTDFGTPGQAPDADSRAVDEGELTRFETVLDACWRAFDEARAAAQGRTLRKGPRGGGRDLEKMVGHVLDAHAAYLRKLGWKPEAGKEESVEGRLRRARQGTVDGLRAGAAGELPEHGPRGGKRWTPRYFVRRAAWHVLDHAWEIEDRMV